MKTVRLYGDIRLKIKLLEHDLPIETVPPPESIILPLSDRIDISCNPLVERGELVLKGERIGEDPQKLMTPIYSPISGNVTDIKPYRFTENGTRPSIFIESDYQETWKTEISPLEDFANAEPVRLIMAAGNAGVEILPREFMPGPKNTGNALSPVKYLVINGIGHGFAGSIEKRLLLERSEELLEGVQLIKRMLQPEKIYLAINEKHEELNKGLIDSGLAKIAEVLKLDVYYPLGHPYLLFKKIFNEDIPCPGGRAIDMGVLFIGVETVIHALEAVKQGKPVNEKHVTVSGEGISSPRNLKVRIGTPLKDLIEFCGGFKGKPGRIVLGNPLDGMAQFSLDRPVLKDTRWLWVEPEEDVVMDKYRACINCGDCVDVCPVGLMPNFLGKYCEFSRFEEAAAQYDLFTCIDCGLCAYVCPSRRPLVQFINYGKRELISGERNHANG